MPKCKICGARIEDGIAVCPSCGAKVVSSSALPAAGTNANVAAGTVRPRVSSTTQVIKTTCAHCGAEVIGEHRFCPQCGVNLKEAAAEKKAASAPQERRCPQCGSVVQANSRFCPDCGVTLARGTGTTQASPKASPSAVTSPKKPAATVTASASSSSASVTHTTPVNTRNLRISLIPEFLSETTEYFDTVQDVCASSVMSDKGGSWTIAVEGNLTGDELDSIVALAARTDSVKCLDFSSSVNVQSLKTDYFFSEDVFGRCKSLKSVKLWGGSTKTNPNSERQKKKKIWKGIAVVAGILVLVGVTIAIAVSGASSSSTVAQQSHSSASSGTSGSSSSSVPSSSAGNGSSTASIKSILKSSDFVLVEGDSSIRSFYMCRHEVTQEEYQAVIGKNPSHFKGDRRPVENCSWYNVLEYCNKQSLAEGLTPCYSGSNDFGYSCNFNANGYRLPSEAEWEYAARDGKHRSPYKYSGSDDIASVAWYVDNTTSTHDVMTKAPNRLGLYDMSGNVSEYCCAEYNPGYNGVHRGGGWCNLKEYCTVSYQRHSSGDNYIGFRLVRNAQ